MPKPKLQANTPPTFKDYLAKYEPNVLIGAVNGLDGSIAWELMRAYMRLNQRSFEVAALDLAGHSGKECEAAKASGYALACEDMAEKFMQDLTNVVAGRNGYVEGPERVEE